MRITTMTMAGSIIKQSEKNLSDAIRKAAQAEVIAIQSGKYGPPTVEDLTYAGKLHGFIDELNIITSHES